MQLHTSYKKKNIFVFFSFGVSLETWSKQKILDREVTYYNRLKKNKFNITFVTYGDKNDLKFQNKIKNIKIIPIFNYIKKNFITKYLIFFIAPFLLRNKLNKCEIIKCHQISGGFLSVVCAFFKNKKLVVRAGWEPTQNRKKWDIGILKYLLLSLNSIISYKYSNKIITTSAELKKFICSTYLINKNKVKVIPNGIDINTFKKLKFEKKINKVINISRLEKQKNLFTLIDICKLSNLSLDIIGSGSQLNELKKYSREIKVNIRFFGQINNNKLPRLLSRYNFYLTSSRIEGSPKSVIEAMASGLPIIGLTADGLKPLVINSKTGYLFKDIKKTVKKIEYLKNNKRIIFKMGKLARRHIEGNYSLDKNITLEQNIFYELINKKKS